MSRHNSAVFNNSCIKVPRNPTTKSPCPTYDQKLIHQLENQARKLSLNAHDSPGRKPEPDNLKSFINFFDSIPEYDDVNHLSNREFYKKLDNLKEKQRSYFDYLNAEHKFENKTTAWIEDYKNLDLGNNKNKSSLKSYCGTPIKSSLKNDELDSMASSDKEAANKPPSRRSVRIETPTDKSSPDLEYFRSKSRADISSAGSKRNKSESPFVGSNFDDFSDLDGDLTTKSAPSSPRKPCVGWKDCGITIPEPFLMTVRDEENKIVEELLIKANTTRPPCEDKQQLFRAHPVPVESQIPLFDKIMYDQECRRQIVKRRSKDALRSQMRPFSFTKREEEMQALTKRLSKSSPSLFLCDDKPLKVKQFKAKPVPKNLFSNYIYRKMHEDEYYRSLQKKIRAEEMLKTASLPPAMAKREKNKPKCHICPRSYRDLDMDDDWSVHVPSSSKHKHENLEKELAELELDFILSSPSPYQKSRSKKKSKKKGKRGNRKSSAESSSSTRSQSALESVNRSNLAAVLRIQSARKRMEDEISRRLDQDRIKDESRWREKVMRRRPVWQTLVYSHEEDLNMRLQLRRDEERLRKEEHKMRMQTMLGRVNQQPTLFERQSQARYAKTREELISKLYKDLGRYSASSKISTSDNSETRSVVEMKDEAIQAQFDEIFKDEENAAVAGDAEDNESAYL